MSPPRRVAAVVAAAMVGSLMVLGSGAAKAAPASYDIEVGKFLFNPQTGEGPPGESMRYFPSTLKVHKGDTLNFSGGFHTAALIPANTGVQEWIDANAKTLGTPWNLLAPNPDDAARPAKFNNRAIFPSCEAPCLYDGSDVVNSGVFDLTGPFSVTVNAEPGDTFWAICLVHNHMRMKIQVVADDVAATDPQSIPASTSATVAQDTDDAAALHDKLQDRKTKRVTADGKVVWDAWVGYDTHAISLFDMYPRRLTVRKGQTVRWHFNQLVYEDHTVSFPQGKALEIANSAFQSASCDPNDSVAGDETAPNFSSGFPVCAEGQVELFLVPQEFAFEQGDGVASSRSEFLNSGIGGAQAFAPLRGSAPYDVKFGKPAAKPYKYVCMIHTFMRGKVVVK